MNLQMQLLSQSVKPKDEYYADLIYLQQNHIR
jgi:hypothetical protein